MLTFYRNVNITKNHNITQNHNISQDFTFLHSVNIFQNDSSVEFGHTHQAPCSAHFENVLYLWRYLADCFETWYINLTSD